MHDTEGRLHQLTERDAVSLGAQAVSGFAGAAVAAEIEKNYFGINSGRITTPLAFQNFDAVKGAKSADLVDLGKGFSRAAPLLAGVDAVADLAENGVSDHRVAAIAVDNAAGYAAGALAVGGALLAGAAAPLAVAAGVVAAVGYGLVSAVTGFRDILDGTFKEALDAWSKSGMGPNPNDPDWDGSPFLNGSVPDDTGYTGPFTRDITVNPKFVAFDQIKDYTQDQLRELARAIDAAKQFGIDARKVGLGLIEGAKGDDGPGSHYDPSFNPGTNGNYPSNPDAEGFNYHPPSENSSYPYGGNTTPTPGANGGPASPSYPASPAYAANPGSYSGVPNGGNQSPSTQSNGGPYGGSPNPTSPSRNPADNWHNSSPTTSSNPNSSYPYGGNTTPNSSGAEDDGSSSSSSPKKYQHFSGGWTVEPIVLDLYGNGVRVSELTKSQRFVEAGGDGLKNRSAWAGAGDGVLFYDADGSGGISDRQEFIFSEWDPTAPGDLEAIRSRFDSNEDGKLDANDALWASFKVEVANADGTVTVKTLAEAGITSIDLTANAVRVELPDGSVITGQTTYTKAGGGTGTVANMLLAYDADGDLDYLIRSVAELDGSTITNYYDDSGDHQDERTQLFKSLLIDNGASVLQLSPAARQCCASRLVCGGS